MKCDHHFSIGLLASIHIQLTAFLLQISGQTVSFMSLSGMTVAFKASSSSVTQQQWWHPTRDQCQYGFTFLSERKFRKRPVLLGVKAISGKLDLDFSDPSWKQKYQEDWDGRFSLPHITDIYDLEPRTTTFSLKKNRTPLGDGDVSSTDMRNGYVNKDDRALLKVNIEHI